MRPKFDPAIHDENALMSKAFMEGMKPSRRGRPKLADAKEVVTLRMRPDVIKALQEEGPDWRSKLERLAVAYIERRDLGG